MTDEATTDTAQVVEAIMAAASVASAPPTHADRVLARANKMLPFFCADAASVSINLTTTPEVTFQRLSDWLRAYASCLLAAAQMEQDSITAAAAALAATPKE